MTKDRSGTADPKAETAINAETDAKTAAKDGADAEPPSLEHVPLNERVLRLEIHLAEAHEEIKELQKPVKPVLIWKDRRFLAGLFALPVLIASGWLLTFANSAFVKTPYFQPLPFLHTALGTEEAMKAYVSPHKTFDRGAVVDEIKELVRTANGERGQNFNDFFVQHLGLRLTGAAQATDCQKMPNGAVPLTFNKDDTEVCFDVTDAFQVSDQFTVLRPRDVTKIAFEVFVVPQKATGAENNELTSGPMFIDADIRDKFFVLRVNGETAKINSEGVEIDLIDNILGYKFTAEYTPDQTRKSDRTYDIYSISLNLDEYDVRFKSERRDKSFTIFVVPKFETS